MSTYGPRNLPASSRESPKPIWVRSLVPKEKNSASFAISSAVTAARGTSIMVPIRYSTPADVLAQHAMRLFEHDRLLTPQLLDVADERNHDLGTDLDALLRDLKGRLEDRARLHARDLRVGDAEAAAAMTEHRVELVQPLDLVEHLLGAREFGLAALLRRHLDHQILALGEELVERRVEGADGDGIPLHLREEAGEVALLHGHQLLERALVLLDGRAVRLLRRSRVRP